MQNVENDAHGCSLPQQTPIPLGVLFHSFHLASTKALALIVPLSHLHQIPIPLAPQNDPIHFIFPYFWPLMTSSRFLFTYDIHRMVRKKCNEWLNSLCLRSSTQNIELIQYTPMKP